jgi:methylmalonyl-CoA mutase
LLEDLENGVTSLWLQLGPGRIQLGDLPDLLAGVQLDAAPLAIDAGEQAATAAELIRDLAGERGLDPHALTGTLGFDPIGVQARTGLEHPLGDAVAWALRCADETPLLRAITVDALAYHEAGASDAQELGCALATGVAYLRALRSAGMPLTDAAAQVEFRYAATTDQFSTIAKLRAARLLWSRVAEVAGIPLSAAGQRQHAVSSAAMTTRRDPWGNLLRATLACFGAGLGGADAVTVLPFDAAIGQPDAFSRRIARNTQTLLMEESNLSRVIDPAGGSWYVEQLTAELARQAWATFQRIDIGGGIVAGLSDGTVADTLAVTAAERRTRLARRQQRIVGVTDFVLLDEPDLTRGPWPDEPAGGLPRLRWAAAYEALRDRSEAMLAATGTRPTVLLMPLGSGRDVNARTTFAAGALQPGGIATPMADGALPPDVRAACLCLGADIDTEELARTAHSLRAAGASILLAAGAPADSAASTCTCHPGRTWWPR